MAGECESFNDRSSHMTLPYYSSIGPDMYTWNGKSGHLEPQDRTLEGYWVRTLANARDLPATVYGHL